VRLKGEAFRLKPCEAKMERTTIRRFPQPGKTECGLAAVSAVVSIYPSYANGFDIESVIRAAGIVDTIKSGGTIDDIRNLVGQDIPIIVDWQGSTFIGSDGGKGHYSVITGINDKEIKMVDSLPEFANGRTISIKDFEELWWDTDSIVDNEGNETSVTTRKLIFIVVPNTQTSEYIQKFKMLPGDKFPDKL